MRALVLPILFPRMFDAQQLPATNVNIPNTADKVAMLTFDFTKYTVRVLLRLLESSLVWLSRIQPVV